MPKFSTIILCLFCYIIASLGPWFLVVESGYYIGVGNLISALSAGGITNYAIQLSLICATCFLLLFRGGKFKLYIIAVIICSFCAYSIFSQNSLSSIIALIGIVFIITVILKLKKHIHNLNGSNARYGSLSDLKKAGLNTKEGIVLGRKNFQLIRSNKPLSLLIAAPPGVGKTYGFILPNLTLCQNSMVIYDAKGELYNATAQIRKNKLGHKVLLFDPASFDSASYNFFDRKLLPDNLKQRQYIENIASKLIQNDHPENKYFIRAARQVFIFFARWMLFTNKQSADQEISISDIRSKILSFDSSLAALIKQMLITENLPYDIILDGREALLAENSDRQWAGIIGTLSEALQVFADPFVANATSNGCDFTAQELRHTKSTLYIKIRDIDKERLSPIIALLISSISSELISTLPNKGDNNITFILDEFVRLGRLRELIELPSISRSYKVNTIFVIQDYGQLAKTYSNDDISIIETNCAYKIIMRQNNFMTAKRISELIGNKRIKKNNKSHNSEPGKLFTRSTTSSTQENQQPLITPQEILNLKQYRAILIVEGFAARPFKIKSAKEWVMG